MREARAFWGINNTLADNNFPVLKYRQFLAAISVMSLTGVFTRVGRVGMSPPRVAALPPLVGRGGIGVQLKARTSRIALLTCNKLQPPRLTADSNFTQIRCIRACAREFVEKRDIVVKSFCYLCGRRMGLIPIPDLVWPP